MTPAPFESTTTIRFGHCDPAGIVFYPRYFELINALVEDWFEQGLGISFHELHTVRQVGTPTATINTDFRKPSRWNDVIRQRLTVRQIGSASFEAEVTLSGEADDLRVRARLTIVTVDLATIRPRSLPDDLRAAMQRFHIPEPAPLS